MAAGASAQGLGPGRGCAGERRLRSTWPRCCSISFAAARASRAPARRRWPRARRCECSAECDDWYISAISASATAGRPAAGPAPRCPACAPARRGSRPAAACGRPRRCGPRRRLGGQVGAQLGRSAPAVMTAHSCRTMLPSTSLRTSNTWRASSTLGWATKAPRAGSSVTRWSRLSWFSAWRTSVRLTLKMSAICCSASLVPGIRRRSTMAVVMDSTMRSVAVSGAGSAGDGTAVARRPVARDGLQVGGLRAAGSRGSIA
jgi:hypothetical protein